MRRRMNQYQYDNKDTDKNIVSDETIKKWINEQGYSYTDNVRESIYILRDGTMMNGEFHYGARCVEHREIEKSVITDKSRFDRDFWTDIHERTGMIMVVPETEQFLVMNNQTITENQRKIIEMNPNFKVIEYCRNRTQLPDEESVSMNKQKDEEIEI